MKILVKVTNGKQIYMEDITNIVLSENTLDTNPIKIKEKDLESYNNHILYDWVDIFLIGDEVPLWLSNSDVLEFELLYK